MGSLGFFTLLFISASAIGQDSLVRFSELKFTSAFEKQAFREFFKSNGNAGAMELFLSATAEGSSQKSAAESRISAMVKKLASAGLDAKKPEKRVKAIYDQVHAAFLTKYEMVNRFDEVFSSGRYNCVTATALYALIFDQLKIPYSIQEKPTHVFLVAYPNQNNILVETTSPLFGYLSFDARYKETFLNSLKNAKLISASEMTSLSADELFNKYYFQNENISLRQLIGIHYMNDALFKNDANNPVAAFQQIEKAYFFYPSQRCRFLLTHLAAEILHKEKLAPLDRAWFIAKVSRYREQGVTAEMVKGEFVRVNDEVLIKQNNRALYQQCVSIIINHGIEDPELKSEILYLQFYEMGRINHNLGNYPEAKYYFGKALEQQPNNVELTGIFLNALVQSMRNLRQDYGIADSVMKYKVRFPALSQNNNFNSLVAGSFLLVAKEKVDKGDAPAAEEKLKEFETMYAANKNLTLDEYEIGSAYSALLSYYFKKGQKEKAKAILKRGLALSPDNYELRTRQQMLNY